ncbi:MAG: glycosyltransferase family 2 protein, partial [Chitinophagaceae bacterium]|nr:glycosyltransferase family 2 protein [Chitinophagaceae bacterium]
MKTPLISICIPAYKNEAYLKRLLDSIGEQSFKDFEVIVTDDSNSDAIRLLCARYQSAFDLSYYGNPSALGSPENWNESIRKANGEWIKIMHDDDWFVDKGSLKKFALKAGDGKVDFIFSGYYNINLDTGKKKKFTLNQFQNFLLRRNPLNLLKRNLIGHPSTTLIKNTQNLFFDK